MVLNLSKVITMELSNNKLSKTFIYVMYKIS